jgi:hypothetical protein
MFSCIDAAHFLKTTALSCIVLITLPRMTRKSPCFRGAIELTLSPCQGVVFTWGDGRLGKLGHNDESTRLLPTLVNSFFDQVRAAFPSRFVPFLRLFVPFSSRCARAGMQHAAPRS